jgi:N-methylhydantoinase B
MDGAAPGSKGEITVNDGAPFERPDRADLAAGDRVTLRQPGGGGFGPARERDPLKVAADLRDGYISIETARRDYGVVLNAKDGQIDETATGELRGAKLNPA